MIDEAKRIENLAWSILIIGVSVALSHLVAHNSNEEAYCCPGKEAEPKRQVFLVNIYER